MATVGVLYREIGLAIGDPANVSVKTWKLLNWINLAIEEGVRATNCLWATETLTGQREIVVLDYTGLEDITITVTVDGTASVLTEMDAGGSFNAVTSNTQTATNITTALNTITGVKAYSSSATIRVLATGGATIDSITTTALAADMTIADEGYETFLLTSFLTRFRRVNTIYEAGNDVIYEPYTRPQYDLALMQSSGFTGDIGYVSPSNVLYLKKAGANLTGENQFTIDFLQTPAALTLATESPPGITADYTDYIVRKVCYYYYLTQGKYNDAKAMNALARQHEKEMRRDLRSQGDPLPTRHLIQWY
jgi:hypothetical protein